MATSPENPSAFNASTFSAQRLDRRERGNEERAQGRVGRSVGYQFRSARVPLVRVPRNAWAVVAKADQSNAPKAELGAPLATSLGAHESPSCEFHAAHGPSLRRQTKATRPRQSWALLRW